MLQPPPGMYPEHIIVDFLMNCAGPLNDSCLLRWKATLKRSLFVDSPLLLK
jgi:hypothetical protein